jgi:hypothetical protein
MKPALIALALTAVVAFASPVTVSQTFSGTPCGSAPFTPGATGIGGATVTLTVSTDYEPPGIGARPASSCLIAVTADLITNGPVRAGFLEIVGMAGVVDQASAGLFLNGVEVDGCSREACGTFIGTIPFTLGIPFELQVTASGTSPPYPGLGCCFGASYYQATVRVYELGGDLCPGVPSGPCLEHVYQDIDGFEAPEPATWLLTLAGLGFLWRKRPPQNVKIF